VTGGVGAARIRASDLYDLAVCPHRVALDRRHPREARTPPDEATDLLIRRGLALEEEVARALGYPRPEYPAGDYAEGARQTRALMERGVPGIYQGVLDDGRHLAIPDLLRRVPGDSALGGFHYEPGDVKAAFDARADHVLQVGFAGRLLADVQGRDPARGFLVLGDRREESFPLGELAHVLASAISEVERILTQGSETFAFLGPGCTGCRWRGLCVPALVDGGDLSLVDGMTRTRHRVLRRHGVRTVGDLATLDPAAWRRGDRPPLGLDLLTRQARALAAGRVELARPLEWPARPEGALLLWLERDPLNENKVVLAAWTESGAGGAAARPEVRPLLDDDHRTRTLGELAERVRRNPSPLVHFGAGTARALETLADAAQLDARGQDLLASRLLDLGDVLRRGAAFLPVWRYELEQVDAALAGRALPRPDRETTGEDAPAFVLVSHLAAGTPGPWREKLEAFGARRIERLARVFSWALAQPRAPHRGAS